MSAPAPPADPSSAAVLDSFLFVDVDKVRFVITLALGRALMAALENIMVVMVDGLSGCERTKRSFCRLGSSALL